MTKQELKKQLSSYTKKQIIDALLIACKPGTYNEHIIYQMQNYLNDIVLKDENIEIDAAQKEWQEAADKQTEYAKYLSNKYGKKVIPLAEVTNEESVKVIALATDEQQLYNKLNKLQDAQEKRQLKILQKC